MSKIKMLVVMVGLMVGVATGCAQMKGMVDRSLFHATAYQTNQVAEKITQVATNRIVVTAGTNAAGDLVLVTNREPAVMNIIVPAHEDVVPIAWEPNAATVATVTGLTSLVPGWGSLAGMGFTALLGIIAQVRSRRFKEALISTCQGVEHVTAAFAGNGRLDIAQSMKSAIEEMHEDDGVSATVDNILAKHVSVVPRVKV